MELPNKMIDQSHLLLKQFRLIRLVEIVGDIADHAQNASDRMRAMIAR